MEVLRENRPGARPETDAQTHTLSFSRLLTATRNNSNFSQIPLRRLDRSAKLQSFNTQ